MVVSGVGFPIVDLQFIMLSAHQHSVTVNMSGFTTIILDTWGLEIYFYMTMSFSAGLGNKTLICSSEKF